MFSLTRPGAKRIAAFLAAQRECAFSYSEVGATRGVPPSGYVVDHHRVRLGAGSVAFERAVAALRAWRMTSLGWSTVHPVRTPIEVGQTVAVVVRHYGFWSLNACRVVYVLDDEGDDGVRRMGFAYGTLPDHGAIGEERFTVEWRRADDSVWYDLYALSRAGHPLMRLGYPLARRLQRRFARDSQRAMCAAADPALGALGQR